MRKEQGFSNVEVLISVVITLILLGGTMSSFNSSAGLSEESRLMADLGQNLRTGINFTVRDFLAAGWGIPTGGIPIPSGTGAVDVRRPGPPGAFYIFDSLAIASVNPGAGLGPASNGQATDMVNILYSDNTLPLNQTPLAAIAANGSSVTVNAGTPITGISNPISTGDLIAFSNALGNTMQYVTRVSGQTIFFDAGDPLCLNQPAASQGSITQIKNGAVFPPTTATRVWLITYYLDVTTDPEMPRLIRRVNNQPGEAVALVLDNFQLSYDLVDGVTNPTGVADPVAPNSPNQIRKANVFISGRSTSRFRNTGEFLRRTLTTQVSLRSLSFIDRYI
jgi:type II secretory pathway pseudopilin PulG